MMQETMDLATMGTSYGLTTLVETFLHIYNGRKEERREAAERDQERWYLLANKSYDDVNSVRESIAERDKTEGFWGGSFHGWTRRLLAWIVIAIFVIFLIGELRDIPINLVYAMPKHFLFWNWTSYLVKTMYGIVWSPYIRDFCDVIVGFYMGHFTVKSFRS